MKDRILIFLYETLCALKELAVVFCALFGIKLKSSVRVDWIDKLLMMVLLVICSVLILFLIKFDDILNA